jgi:hypothetical protein
MTKVVEAVGEAFGIAAADLRAARGGSARMIVAWLGWYEGWQPLRSIAAALRLASCGRVSDLIRRGEEMLRNNPSMQARVDRALEILL